ncbi:MAG: hypothetical protein R8P61_02820 [Bacteroidia bacterium]|nr:hypothetical protein [Bacteroidia bacterium]
MTKKLPFSTIVLTTLLVLGCFSQSFAQDWMYDFGMNYSRSLGEFREDGYKDGFGFHTGLYSSPIRANNGFVNLRLGMRMDFDFAGKSQNELIAQAPETDYIGAMQLENSSLGLHGVFRIESTRNFPVQLYVEGLLGARSLSTSEAFDENSDWQEDHCEDFSIERDWSLSYGASAGTLIRLNDRTRLNLRASYMTSRPSTFVALSTAQQVEDNLYTYELRTAPATQFRMEAGISVDLDMECTPSRSSLMGGRQ